MIKLLIADDEKGLCKLLEKFFKPRGYEVYVANTGQDVVSRVKEIKPELVLLDLNLTGIGGLEILRTIKKVCPQTKVIIVTISDDADTRQKAKILGADEFVKKPFTTDYLEDVVIMKVNEMIKSKDPAKILIVDDQKGIRDNLKKFLQERFECQINEAGRAEEALKLARKDKFDLIFVDIKMPGLSGTEIIKEKKKLGYQPYIWVITGYDSGEVAHKVIEQGADDYIPKPFSLRVLDSKVRNFLAQIGKYKPLVR